MSDMTTLARKATSARLFTMARAAHRMTPSELDLMDRLLDEYARKSKAWHREAREQAKADAAQPATTEAGDTNV